MRLSTTRTIILLSCTLLACGATFAQEVPSESPTPGMAPTAWVSVSGPHMDKDSYNLLSVLVESGSDRNRDEAMDALENLLRQGKSDGNDPNLVQLLSRICLEPLVVLRATGTRRGNEDPMPRIRAIRLLALAGGTDSLASIQKVLELEDDPWVLGEAYHAWRQFLPDRPELVPLMARHLSDPFPGAPHPGMVMEILQTVEALHRQYRNMGEPPLFRSIMGISLARQYGRTCTRKAREVLDYLRKPPGAD